MIARLTIANLTPNALALQVQAEGLSGTISASIGAGAWGIEQGATVEMAGVTGDAIETFAKRLMRELKEEAVYISYMPEVVPVLLFADGSHENL